MHTFKHHNQEKNEQAPASTQGHIIDWGWRYDLMLLWGNVLSLGKWKALEQHILDMAHLQAGEQVLDVGCGTGVLALKASKRVGSTGRVYGIDPGPKQIARARQKAARAKAPINFQVGMIEHLTFPDDSFDIVLSTLMMHVLPDELKRQGIAEIARVLKPGGRVLIVDTRRPEENQSQPARPVHTGPWNSGIQDQPALLQAAGFVEIKSGEIETGTTRFPEIGFVQAIMSPLPEHKASI